MKRVALLAVLASLGIAGCSKVAPTQQELANCQKFNLDDSDLALRSCIDGQITQRPEYLNSEGEPITVYEVAVEYVPQLGQLGGR